MGALNDINILPWLIAAVVVPLLVWLAWRRPNRRRLLWRVAASIVAGVSLVLLLFPPTYQRVLDPSTAILLTDGYSENALEALLDTATAEPLLFRYKTEATDATPVPDLYTLRQQHPSIQTVHLLGYGLEEQELQALEGTQLVPHLSTAPMGITTVHWPESIKTGEAVVVSGKYKGAAGEEAMLYLQAAGSLQDSVAITNDSTYTFRLRYTPKQAGRYTYAVVARYGERTDTLGHVPVQVEEPDKLRVLLLASSPMFEFRFLKNHLAALQHQVALRTIISKGISQSEWLNMPQTNLDRLTPKLLQQFDVVITEPQMLQHMSNAERSSLQQAVSEDGLGVLTIAGEQPGNRSTAFFTSFRTARVGQQETRTARASWSGEATGAVTALPYTFVKEDAVTGLVEEQGAQLLAAGKQAGWGTVAITAVPQTFSWQLEGKQQTYSSYWAHLLSSVAKKEAPEKLWLPATPKVPQPRQPVTLTYTDYTYQQDAATPTTSIISLKDSTETGMALAQNPLQPEQFTGTFHPRHAGWHVAQAPEAAPYYFFVQDTSDWAFAGIQARLKATQKYAAQQSIAPAEEAITYTEEQVSLFWFFALFVLSSGFLWLEEKL